MFHPVRKRQQQPGLEAETRKDGLERHFGTKLAARRRALAVVFIAERIKVHLGPQAPHHLSYARRGHWLKGFIQYGTKL